MKKNVLVFPCGSEVGLEVYKSLSFSTHFRLIGGSSADDHGKFVFENYVDGIPFVDEPDFLEKVNAVVADQKVDFIIPAHDNVLLKLAQAEDAGQLDCELITSPLETCEIATSKLKTYDRLKDIVPTPKIFKDASEVTQADLPIFLKPEVGNGSRGTNLAKTFEDVAFYTGKDSSLLLLEYLPGKEYTIDCFTNKNGELMYSAGRQRRRISNGISVNSEGVIDERFNVLAEEINKRLEFRGMWFFQVKENAAGGLVLMEIAPRCAGTMGLARSNGVNLPLLSLFDRMGYDVSVLKNSYNMVIDRALQNAYRHDIDYKHIYIDFDDLVVFEGKVNPMVMAFVFQCYNKGIAIHVLTRHKEDLEKTLERYHLAHLFDDITWITDGSPKHTHIKEKDAIFIDDSFAEREAVHEALGVPVFDAHMIESLMEV